MKKYFFLGFCIFFIGISGGFVFAASDFFSGTFPPNVCANGTQCAVGSLCMEIPTGNSLSSPLYTCVAPGTTKNQICGNGLVCEAGNICVNMNRKCPPNTMCVEKAPEYQCKKNTRPTICPMNIDPVCGSDNKTYNNGCVAEGAGVGILYAGACAVPTTVISGSTACSDGSTCQVGYRCVVPPSCLDSKADHALGFCDKPVCVSSTLSPTAVCGNGSVCGEGQRCVEHQVYTLKACSVENPFCDKRYTCEGASSSSGSGGGSSSSVLSLDDLKRLLIQKFGIPYLCVAGTVSEAQKLQSITFTPLLDVFTFRTRNIDKGSGEGFLYGITIRRGTIDKKGTIAVKSTRSISTFCPISQNQNSPEKIGGDTDTHGCLLAAGYSWCEVKNKCLRPFEEKCEVEKKVVSGCDLPLKEANSCPCGPVSRVGDSCRVDTCADGTKVVTSAGQSTRYKVVRQLCMCLGGETEIATPMGSINVKDLKKGMMAWTIDKNGTRISVPIARVSQISIPVYSRLLHVILVDGRVLDVSPGHPTSNGLTMGQLKAGDVYDGSVVQEITPKDYFDTHTYDLLPSGETGFYWANGILVGSTLKGK